MHEEEADEALMRKIAQGDQVAFRVLMARHMERIIRIAETVLRSSAHSDDVAQETFVRVWSRAATFNPEIARFTTWLYRIAVNLAVDRSRQPTADPIEHAEHVAADEPNALVNLIAEEERNAVAQCMSELSAHQRAAISLFHFEGLHGREAAAAMQMSEKAFESLLMRARATLRQRVMLAQARPRR